MKILALLALSAPALAGAAGDLPADPLPGRLFHSASERAALDHLGRDAPPAAPTRTPVPAAARPSASPPARSQQLKGFVLRSDGHDTYWVSGAARNDATGR